MATQSDFSGVELARIYNERFSAAELEGKQQLWEALYEGFFRQYIRTSDTVLDLGAGSCEFINACHAVNAPIGTAAVSTNVADFGLSAASFSARTAYSAQPPPKSA